MSLRYTPPEIGQLSDEQQRVAEKITGGMRGEIPGPLNMWLLRPELADRAQHLGEYARYQSSLPPELSEIAILTVARHWGSEFEWCAHKKIALAAGISADVIECIRNRQDAPWQRPEQSVVHEFTKELLENLKISDSCFEKTVLALGRESVVDLVGIIGYYSFISMTINVFDVPIPDGVAPELSA
jgi:4-carboxymuconolactone decarboxylase